MNIVILSYSEADAASVALNLLANKVAFSYTPDHTKISADIVIERDADALAIAYKRTPKSIENREVENAV